MNITRFTPGKIEIRRILDPNNTVNKTVIYGYAAVFNSKSELLFGMFEEYIDLRAFDNVLTQDVRALFNHDANLLLGRTQSGTLKLSVDEIGLKYEIDVPDTQLGRDLLVQLERGDITGSSFGFELEENGDVWDEKATPIKRTLLNVKRLIDVGPVVWPAYPETSAGIRSAENIEPETVEKLLKIEEKKIQNYLRLKELELDLINK